MYIYREREREREMCGQVLDARELALAAREATAAKAFSV